jgi:hypothetical protein
MRGTRDVRGAGRVGRERRRHDRAIHVLAIAVFLIATALVATAAHAGFGVQPFIDCKTVDEFTNQMVVYWGSNNTNSFEITVDTAFNFFIPGPSNRDQPVSFAPGVHHFQSTTISDASLPALSGSDSLGAPIAFSISAPPSHGTLSGDIGRYQRCGRRHCAAARRLIRAAKQL